MSQKKHKKRHANSSARVKKQAAQAELADRKDRARKRMDPTARMLLLGDIVLLAASQMLYSDGLISEMMYNLTALLGFILLLLALWVQFGRKGGSSWPGLR